MKQKKKQRKEPTSSKVWRSFEESLNCLSPKTSFKRSTVIGQPSLASSSAPGKDILQSAFGKFRKTHYAISSRWRPLKVSDKRYKLIVVIAIKEELMSNRELKSTNVVRGEKIGNVKEFTYLGKWVKKWAKGRKQMHDTGWNKAGKNFSRIKTSTVRKKHRWVSQMENLWEKGWCQHFSMTLRYGQQPRKGAS